MKQLKKLSEAGWLLAIYLCHWRLRFSCSIQGIFDLLTEKLPWSNIFRVEMHSFLTQTSGTSILVSVGHNLAYPKQNLRA